MQPTTEHASLHAPDISCAHCVNAIQARLGNLQGVSNVSASAQTKRIEIDFDPARISLDTIKNELDDEGYPVSDESAVR